MLDCELQLSVLLKEFCDCMVLGGRTSSCATKSCITADKRSFRFILRRLRDNVMGWFCSVHKLFAVVLDGTVLRVETDVDISVGGGRSGRDETRCAIVLEE